MIPVEDGFLSVGPLISPFRNLLLVHIFYSQWPSQHNFLILLNFVKCNFSCFSFYEQPNNNRKPNKGQIIWRSWLAAECERCTWPQVTKAWLKIQ